jgi:hypothetical protein
MDTGPGSSRAAVSPSERYAFWEVGARAIAAARDSLSNFKRSAVASPTTRIGLWNLRMDNAPKVVVLVK